MRWLRHNLFGTEFIVVEYKIFVNGNLKENRTRSMRVYEDCFSGDKYIKSRKKLTIVCDLNKESYFWLYKRKE